MNFVKLIFMILIIGGWTSGLHADELAIRNCAWCHGTSAQGYMTAPRLAGQRYEYLEKQLLNFKNHTRDNPFSMQYMWDAVAYLDPQTARDLALYFSTLPPKPANDGDWNLVPVGKAIYDGGIPQENVVACTACHGPAAEGVREIPRLGGLSYAYLKRRLDQWGEGFHAAAQLPMPFIAGKLSPADIEALASYLSFVR
ncbi:MAG: cytochrome c [Xanthobacteraceae bacterium]|nr:cytochrome c [Xanthobacteraceae bacterium]MBV9628671.1 cytochrome c [Xanthobacteraceae bacterium]